MRWPRWFPIDNPAFRWGLVNPFGPPAPWWPDERRQAYFAEHGVPWRRSCTRHGEWWCPDCGDWINHGDTKAVGDFTVHKWCS